MANLLGRKQSRVVMGTFGKGRLRSSSGETVTDIKQAEAIAASEQRAAEKKGTSKRTWKGRTRMRPLLSK